jgi:hypothetical protein
MTTAERKRDLVIAIATAIADNLKKTIAVTDDVASAYQEQIVNCTYNGTESYPTQDSDPCIQCIENAKVTQVQIDNYHKYLQSCNLNNICDDTFLGDFNKFTKVRSTVCADVCVCNIDVSQSMYVLYKPTAVIQPSAEDVTDMANEVLQILSIKYGENTPDAETIASIVRQVYTGNFCTDTNCSGSACSTATCTDSGTTSDDLFQAISQAMDASQIIIVQGVANVTNVKMTMMVSCVMQAVMGTDVNLLQQAVQQSIDNIKAAVTKTTQQTSQQIWTQFKNQWIALIVVAALSLVLWMVTLVYKRIKKL